MTVLQLVFADDSSSPRIEPRPNPEGKALDELEREGVRAVDVGSDQLIEFASSLSHAGFRVLGVSLVDRYFSEVDDEIAAELEPAFRALISTNLDAAREFKHDFLADLFVSDVKLRNTRTGNVVTLGQEGVVHADADEIEFLAAGLNQAI
ncbi:hypothetical protein [Mycobacterium sp. SM3041]|uniref:hypothetical protein n=1 Tax=Mycobacterium sp. SM3041 TaxID=3114291 RepID=UPI003204DE4A